MSPHFAWEDMNLYTITKLISCPQNPAYNCMIEIRYKNLFENKAKAIKPLNLRIQTLKEIKINLKIIHNTILPKHTPSLSKRNSSTSKTTSQITTTPYIDESKQGMKVDCAAIFQNQELLKCLSNVNHQSIVQKSQLAMNIITNHKSSKFIIYSVSKSVLQALQNKNTSTPLITRLLDKMNTLSKNNSIILTWIPSHIGIHGNERADKTEKKALLADISNTKIPFIDLKAIINKFIIDKWQKSFDNQIQNKLHHTRYNR